MSQDRYPNLTAAIKDGRINPGDPPPERTRKMRCGPWDEQADGTFVCRQCGEVDAPGSGPNGF